MKADGVLFAIANFLVLGATACLEFFQLRGMMFGMGESGGPIGLLGSALLIMTALGILGVTIAALGALTGKRAFAVVGLVSCLFVLPMAILYTWAELHADIAASRLPANAMMSNPVTHVSVLQWIVDGVAVPLDLTAIWLSWLRIRSSPRRIKMEAAGPALQ